MNQPLLDLRQVKRTVKLPDGNPLHILKGVDLEVKRSEHVAILGRSGSGKTTLLNLLGLIDKPTSGEILFRDKKVNGLSENTRAKLRGQSIGFVFQQFNLLDNRTALENVMMPLMYGSVKQFWNRSELAINMLKRVGLESRQDQRPNRLSGGEQQRVAVARALVRKPSLILADEPTGALDVTTGEAIMALLDETARETNAALITITHDLQVAALADRVMLLDDGVLRQIDVNNAADALAATGGIRSTKNPTAPAQTEDTQPASYVQEAAQ